MTVEELQASFQKGLLEEMIWLLLPPATTDEERNKNKNNKCLEM
jgi:hypothetical protein